MKGFLTDGDDAEMWLRRYSNVWRKVREETKKKGD